MWTFIAIVIIVLIIGAFVSFFNDEETKKSNLNDVNSRLGNQNFKVSKVITYNQTECKKEVRIDTENKQIAICNIFPTNSIRTIKFTDIIECEIIEDSNTIMKGGVGRAIVGDVIAGGVGAIVGATTRKSKNVVNDLTIRVVTKNINNSLINIHLISKETNKDTLEYRSATTFANNVYATITAIINQNNNNITKKESEGGQKKMTQNNNDFIEQLERLSKLKNDGMITEQEFEEGKKRILESKNESIVTEDINIESNTNNDEDNYMSNDTYNIEEKIELYGNDKIKIIKALRDETGLGLAEAKDIVDGYMDNKK